MPLAGTLYREYGRFGDTSHSNTSKYHDCYDHYCDQGDYRDEDGSCLIPPLTPLVFDPFQFPPDAALGGRPESLGENYSPPPLTEGTYMYVCIYT